MNSRDAAMQNLDIRPHERIERTYWIGHPLGERRLATESMAPGTSVYGEDRLNIKGREFRVWDPHRSKLAAAIVKGLESIPITLESKVLYLGAASGTTVSHVSDIVGTKGHVFC